MTYTGEVARSKYGNITTEYNGRKFDSKKEAQHAAELDLLRRANNPAERVREVVFQVPFRLDIGAVHICTYVADFVVTFDDGRHEVQDVKGFRTDIYKLKKKLMWALLGIKIIEY